MIEAENLQINPRQIAADPKMSKRSVSLVININIISIKFINPHLKHPQKVYVQTEIIEDRIMGPFFFNEFLTGKDIYFCYKMKLYLLLKTLFEVKMIVICPMKILFQQDGCTTAICTSCS